MKDQGALRPESFGLAGFIEEKEEVEEPTVEEGILAAGADKVFWKTLKQHFNNAIQQLDQINDAAILAGAPREQIGENAIVMSLVKGVLKKIIDKVEDAREAANAKQK